MSPESRTLCVVGLGPRGLSVLERLAANLVAEPDGPGAVTVHLVDPHLLDGSNVWNTNQSAELLMNTVASQVSMFVDDSVECAGPVHLGPSLYEWARFITLLDPFDDIDPAVRAEAADLGPDSYPTRAFYGHYLAWVLEHVIRTAPRGLTVRRHTAEAVDLADTADGRQRLTLADGTELDGLDAVVLTLGHTANAPSERERELAGFAHRAGLRYVPPANPADVDLTGVRAGDTVLLQGLGLTFFDYMALFTVGRGGRFTRDDDGTLRYVPSGREPRLVAGSRRGVPHHARGENQKGAAGRHEPRFFTASVVRRLREAADRQLPVDFEADIWPVVDREVRSVYYATLIAERYCHCDADVFLRHYVTLCTRIREIPGARSGDPFCYDETADERALLERFGITGDERWDWSRIARPYQGQCFPSVPDFEAWLVGHLRDDVREARLGNVRGPVKAALDVLRDLRNEIRLVVDHGRLSGDSYRDDLQQWYTPFNAFVSIGPPASRVEEMVALLEGGVLHMVGPRTTVEPDPGRGRFVARSRLLPDAEFDADVLIEARLPEPDTRRTTSTLLRRLLDRGECTLHRIPQRDGGWYETGGLAVTQRPYRTLDGRRRAHPDRYAFGVPTEAVHWVTAAGIRPGVNSVILGDADAVARAVLRLPDGPVHPTGPAHPAGTAGAPVGAAPEAGR